MHFLLFYSLIVDDRMPFVSFQSSRERFCKRFARCFATQRMSEQNIRVCVQINKIKVIKLVWPADRIERFIIYLYVWFPMHCHICIDSCCPVRHWFVCSIAGRRSLTLFLFLSLYLPLSCPMTLLLGEMSVRTSQSLFDAHSLCIGDNCMQFSLRIRRNKI